MKENEKEVIRLYNKLKHVGWDKTDCEIYAPLTLEINNLKKEKDIIILAHSYQSPDIMYGVADYIGDSYGLSVKARTVKERNIVFCGVYFMAETAKILNPEKDVYVTTEAGCSLADSITVKDIENLRRKYPGVPVVCYVNTTSDIKAVSDICCTSANALKVIESVDSEKVIFVPDQYMAKNFSCFTEKEIITWDGKCIVHENFSLEKLLELKEEFPDAKILAHPECSPEVVKLVDFMGSTTGMIDYIKSSEADDYILVTECGITDRIQAEYPTKRILGTCNICPYMKEINIRDILALVKSLPEKNKIQISEDISVRARLSLDRMIQIS